jgi:hypothetical protein
VLIAATFYMVNPYMLFTFYERAAYAELLAAAWIPLLLLGVLRSRLTIAGIAIPICLLWLTNAPAAVMGCYALAVLGLIRILSLIFRVCGTKAALSDTVKVTAGGMLGIGLAAFYVLPAKLEQRWVQISMPFIREFQYQDNFFFGRLGEPSHDGILRTASLCGLTLLVVAGFSLGVALYSVKRARSTPAGQAGRHKDIIAALAILTCVAAFLLTAPSAFLWRYLPELRFLQFPWRFCAILGATAAALIALAISRTALRPGIAVGIAITLALTFTFGGNYTFRQTCFAAMEVQRQVESFLDGEQYDPTDEYTPMGANALALEHSNPASWIADSVSGSAPGGVAKDYSIALTRRLHFDVSSTGPGFLVISLRDYPGWRIRVNGAVVLNRPHRVDGLIVVPISGGNSRVDITYARTPDETVGWIITAFSLVLLLIVARRNELPK